MKIVFSPQHVLGWTLLLGVAVGAQSPDAWLSRQWSLRNPGEAQVVDLDPVRNYRAPGLRGEDIRLPESAPLSPRQVLVAVLDTGLDRTHPDLKNMIRSKPQECEALAQYLSCLNEKDQKECDTEWLNPRNAKADTDQNGYPMDCYGWSAMGQKSEFDIVGSPFFIDNIGHGTHVAGIIGAQVGNGIGIRGVSPHVKLLPIQVVDDQVNEPLKPMSAPPSRVSLTPEEKQREADGYKLVQDVSDRVARGFLYALREGAEVINLSLGWPQVADSKLLRELIAEANRRGIFIVAAAGNDSTRALLRPCVYEGVICVGALNPDGALSHFSNFGSGVDLAAPGLSILSTYPEEKRPVRFRQDLGYEYLSGTSQASPLVAGAVAEMLARGIPSSQIYARLVHSARPLKESKALFEVYASGEKRELRADLDPLEKFVFSGQLDLERALRTPFRAVIQSSQRERPEVLWDGRQSQFSVEIEMINRGAEIATREVSLQASIKTMAQGAARPQVTSLQPLKKFNAVWAQNEKRRYKVILQMPRERAAELPSDLDLIVEAVFSNGFRQKSVVELEVTIPLESVDPRRQRVFAVPDLPQGRWDWTPLESIDGAQRGEAYLLTEQTPRGYRVATLTLQGTTARLKGPVLLSGTQGLNLVAVMWGVQTPGGVVFGVIEDAPPTEEKTEEVGATYFFDLDSDLRVRQRSRYDSKIVRLPFQVRWLKLGAQTYRPAWIGAGLEPNRKQDLWSRWENRNTPERVQQRLYWLNESFQPEALQDVDKKRFVDFVPGPGDAQGELTALVVKSQGPSSQPSYVQDVSFVTITAGKVSRVMTDSEVLNRSLLEARRGALFNLDDAFPFARGLFWFSEGRLRTQKVTTWDQVENRFQHYEAEALRGHFDSALWTQAVYAGAQRVGAFVITNTEVQYHDWSTGRAVRKSLDRYTFFSDSLQILLAYPLVIKATSGPSRYLPALFATESLDFERGVKLVVPIFAEEGHVVELVSPGTLNIKTGRGCKPFKTPIQLATGETALDFFCELSEPQSSESSKDQVGSSVKGELRRVYLEY
ncbi:MAG: S8 family serine peptidase [Bdellovibrionales bacterium]